MSKNPTYFDENTILSTPNPVSSSSMSSDCPRKASITSNDSLGLLSLDNLEISSASSRRSSGHLALSLQQERALASGSIQRANKLTSLPSRYFKRSEITNNSGEILRSDSTINESDLLPANTSTPRGSVMTDHRKERLSVSSSIRSLSSAMSNLHTDGLQALDQFTMDGSLSSLFTPGEKAEAQLVADEMSWKQAKSIPVQQKEFSIDSEGDVKMSMGAFFKEKSDELSKLLAKSPEKVQPPIPLIDVSSFDCNTTQNKSLSISVIANILSDTQQSPGKVFDYLMNSKKKPVTSISDVKPDLIQKNEVVNSDVEALKENVDSLNIKRNQSPDFPDDKTSRSASSLSNLPNGKLPIETTKIEIIWGCVKPGKNVSQDFVIRNKSNGRIGITCSISNPSFKLIKEGSELNFSNSLKVILHAFESRTITVTFAPTTLGAAADKIIFTSIDPNHKQSSKQFVRLFGYGGYGFISISNVIKDTTGKFLLALGNIDTRTIQKDFWLKNLGTLPCFVCIHFVPNGFHSVSSIRISEHNLVLLPDEEKKIIVSYSIKKDDFRYMQSKINSSVLDIGKLSLIWGTEVDRGRLRRIHQTSKQKNIEFPQRYLSFIEKLPEEIMPNDLKYLRESPMSVDQIVKLFTSTQITLTLEQNLDRTLTEQFEFEDDSAMFYSLCEVTQFNNFESTAHTDSCHVEPSSIILIPPSKTKDMIFLTSNSRKELYFEVVSHPPGLTFKPEQGTLQPGETLIINLKFVQNSYNKSVFKVAVLIEEEAFEVEVKIVSVGSNTKT